MRGLWWLGLVATMAGCPRVARLSFHFDLKSGRGTLIAEDIGTDDPGDADADFSKLIDTYVLGDTLQQDHPAWRLGDRRLYEQDGKLGGIVEFGFSRPIDAGMYQHDRKSAFLWCGDADDEVVATSGEVIPPYPHCVAVDRKARTFDVTLGDDTETVSLLPQFLRWDGRALSQESPPSLFSGGFGNGLSSLLPDVAVPTAWTSLGLPLPGGTVVYTNDRALQASHEGTAAEMVPRYEAALTAAGFVRTTEDSDSSRWKRGEEVLSLSATEAGSTVIVSLARQEGS